MERQEVYKLETYLTSIGWSKVKGSLFKSFKGLSNEKSNSSAKKDQQQQQPMSNSNSNEFTLEHMKLLKKQIETEKKNLEKDLNEYTAIEKNKTNNVLVFKGEPGKKWNRVKNNVLAFTKVKLLNDDLRLWGSTMNVVGLDPKDFEHVKKLMAEHQVDNRVIEVKRRPWMIYPDDIFYNIWTAVYSILLIYTAFVTPYRISFLDETPVWLSVVEYFVDSLFLIDMILTLFTTVQLENGTYITDRKQIFLIYLKGWMFLDFLGIFPLQLFTDNSSNDFIKYLRLPRLFRLVRVIRVFKGVKKIKENKYMQTIQDTLQFSTASVRIFNFLVLVMISIHFVGCMWFFAAKAMDLSPGTWVYEYTIFFYSLNL